MALLSSPQPSASHLSLCEVENILDTALPQGAIHPQKGLNPLGALSARYAWAWASLGERSQPVDKNEGYETMDPTGHVPDHAEIVRCLLQYQDIIDQSDMIYLIVYNRDPADVPHWAAFARWWASRRRLVGPREEKTDILWVTANHQNGLRDVPYYWAGVFVLEAARFLYPRQLQRSGLLNGVVDRHLIASMDRSNDRTSSANELFQGHRTVRRPSRVEQSQTWKLM